MCKGLRIPTDDHETLEALTTEVSEHRHQGEFEYVSETDVRQAVAAVKALIDAVVLPFFERNTSLGDVDQILNAYPNSPATRLLSPDNWMRSANALIVARLAQNPKYEELVDVYRTALAEFAGGALLKLYEPLVTLLKGKKYE